MRRRKRKRQRRPVRHCYGGGEAVGRGAAPAGTPGPAQVASCNCVKPQLLKVTAKRAD
ncbi:hypothetical protein [Streptomyces sp. NBC_01207]|uniref:hypothetical protein n=1 Tax=Streptomyces sp. NBC_01207 TaxID=2903772 RepID=UPI002E11F77A|nr:hypothetical protein OG457_04870 [Streptomyces sp. NBC_01207]